MIIKDKVCLVTGSAVRVGKEIALTLAEKGGKVVIQYRSQENKAIETAKKIEATGAEILVLSGDISARENWIRMKETILEKWGRIDVLVNNASIFYKTPLFNISDKDWNIFMNTNLHGTFLGCQIMGEFMYQNRSGKIINIADVSADNVWPSYIPYCISKAGILALTKGLSRALAPYVTVNAVSPGTVLLADEYDPEEENYLIERTPLRRVGEPKDIANTVAFLIEGSDFITGEIIKVDGGRSLT
jgi:NAD(P)-dependent dehydrogenase (short-subunit alcohol dehydrogenase family)